MERLQLYVSRCIGDAAAADLRAVAARSHPPLVVEIHVQA
jgi:hypothetical protein